MRVQIQKKKIPILMYHSISSTINSRFRQFTVPPESFAEQMAYLHQHDYMPISVTQFVRARSQGVTALPARPVVLTFDDGFADFFTAALPVLQQYRFAATLYVATAFIGGTSRWLRYERETTRSMLTWDQLSEISASGIECGAHSHSHPQLDTLPSMAAKDEVLQSRSILEDHLGLEVLSFAYPHGYHTARVQQLVREAGYTSACAVRYAMSSETDDPFSLARLLVSPDSNGEEFAALLTGRSSPPVTAVYQIYARARASAWRLVRRCVASVTQHPREG